MATDPNADDPEPAAAPAPTPVEKHMLELIEAQARRIAAQAAELEGSRAGLKDPDMQSLLADVKKREIDSRHAQLRLEAWLGLTKVAIVVIAVTLLLWFKLPELLDLLDALRSEPSAPAEIVSAAGGSAPALAALPGQTVTG